MPMSVGSPEAVPSSSSFSPSGPIKKYAYFTSRSRPRSSSKNAISKGISSPAPYLSSHATLTVDDTLSPVSMSTRYESIELRAGAASGTSLNVMVRLCSCSPPRTPLILCSSWPVTRKCAMFLSSYEYGSSRRTLLSTSTPSTYPLKDVPSAYGANDLGNWSSSWTMVTSSMYSGDQSNGMSNVTELSDGSNSKLSTSS